MASQDTASHLTLSRGLRLEGGQVCCRTLCPGEDSEPMPRATKAAAKKAAPKAAKGSTKKAASSVNAKRAVAKSAGKKAAKRAPKKAPVSKAVTKKSASKRAPSKPRRSGALDKFVVGQLEALQEERATYTRQAESLRAEADLLAEEREPGDVQFDEESGEGDTLAVERERDLALSAQASAAVEQIDAAIERINDGTYGTCENCGKAIPKERLRALPYAALCVTCKSGGFARR
jgi:DnaK suppressor protein